MAESRAQRLARARTFANARDNVRALQMQRDEALRMQQMTTAQQQQDERRAKRAGLVQAGLGTLMGGAGAAMAVFGGPPGMMMGSQMMGQGAGQLSAGVGGMMGGGAGQGLQQAAPGLAMMGGQLANMYAQQQMYGNMFPQGGAGGGGARGGPIAGDPAAVIAAQAAGPAKYSNEWYRGLQGWGNR